MNGIEMSKNDNKNETNGSIKREDTMTELPFKRNLNDSKIFSRASIRKVDRRESITSIKSRGGWGNKWGLLFAKLFLSPKLKIDFFL